LPATSFKEQVQPGYTEAGLRSRKSLARSSAAPWSAAVSRRSAIAGPSVKTGQWPTSVRDAGNVIESEANIKDTNIFPGVEGEVAHREALTKTIDDILAGRPVSVEGIINQEFLERSRNMVQRLQTAEPGQPMALPVINQRAIEMVAEHEKLTRRDAELASTLEKLPAGDVSAADRLNRLQAVEQQIAGETDPAALRKLNERKDQILVDTNPEALQAAAAPIEARRQAEAERAGIAARLEDIAQEHGNLQASTLPQMELPALGQREPIPGPKGQFELDLKPPAGAPVVQDNVAGPAPPLQTSEQMNKTLTAPDHQEAIRADIDRARALSDVQVPGVDENGNHVMVGVDKAVDQVDAYKLVAEQLQACANPVQEAAE
jgi:hypothetical protein